MRRLLRPSLRLGLAMTALVICLSAVAQADEVTLKSRVIPAKMTLGDEIKLFIEVTHPKSFSALPPSEKINVSPFELKRTQVLPPAEKNGQVRDTFVLTLTVFELGDLRVPPVGVDIKLPGGRRDRLFTDSQTVKVESVAKNLTGKEDIRPIKGPVSLDLNALRVLVLGALAAILAAVLTVSVLLRRRRRALDLESLKPPHERVVLELGRLKAKGFLEGGKTKEYYSELADILRRYLERRFNLPALEHTTTEVTASMKAKSFDRALTDRVREVLENTDLVKFAKLVPPRALAETLEGQLMAVVEMTKPVETKE